MSKLPKDGVTESERLLTQFCQKSFLKLWTYSNPYKDDGKEFCDSIAVFGHHIFIFFDRRSELPIANDKDPIVLWKRWKKNVIDKQVATAHGAVRYLKAGRNLYLDGKKTVPFPLPINPKSAIFHKIIVAHGAKEACLESSADNIYGSLAVAYTDLDKAAAQEAEHPFYLILDRSDPVHVLDSHNLSIILGELDTVTDLANYFLKKVEAVSRFELLSYCGEEDLLADYYKNIDTKNEHFIGTLDDKINGVMIDQGAWKDFVESKTYYSTKKANSVSYFWDELIQRTCQYALDGTGGGNADLLRGPSAIFEMVKEPRFMRREIAGNMLKAIDSFPKTENAARKVSLLPSYVSTTAYVFLQLQLTKGLELYPDVRERRQAVLEIACGAAKNKFSNYDKIVGIGMQPPKYSERLSEDFLLMPCDRWTSELRTHYETSNEGWNFFGTPTLTKTEYTVNEFVTIPKTIVEKTGRNKPCPCGSQKKYKKCCGN